MWKSFGELFYKNKKDDKIVPWQSVVITNNSPRINISNQSIQLWDHQKAMLFRCKYIEEHPSYAQTKTLFEERYLNKENTRKKSQVPIGILNDHPGTGKTFVILSLILLDPNNTFNIIVVPKNLIAQWCESLEKIFPKKKSNISWTMCNSYSAISSLYTDPKAFSNYRILLIDEMFVDTFALAFTGKAHRVIIDEVDNIEGMMTQHIRCDKLWFMSASFSSYNSDKYKLPYEIDNNTISNIICRCEEKFIQESLKLPEPVTELIICDDADIVLFNNVVPENVIKSMHACNKQSLKKYIEYHDTADITNFLLAKEYELKLENKITKYEEYLVELENKLSKETYESDRKNALLKDRNDIQQKNNETKKQLSNLSNNIIKYKAPKETDTKINKLTIDMLNRLKNNSKSKWLIFNDDIEALFNLNDNKISNIMLDGGTVDKVAEALDKYKKNTQVCLINSSQEGCGLNLENTDTIMFMQATKAELVQQLIGRAQRFGRKDALNIICLFDKMEVIEINKKTT
jgi:hypothetical protein